MVWHYGAIRDGERRKWGWKPPRMLQAVLRKLREQDSLLAKAVNEFSPPEVVGPPAGAERWRDEGLPRQLVLAYTPPLPDELTLKPNLRKIEWALKDVRSGRWEVTIQVLDLRQNSLLHPINNGQLEVDTSVGKATLYDRGRFVDDFAEDLRKAWAEQVAGHLNAEALEEDADWEWAQAEYTWRLAGLFPLRVLERWPGSTYVDFTILSASHLSWQLDVTDRDKLSTRAQSLKTWHEVKSLLSSQRSPKDVPAQDLLTYLRVENLLSSRVALNDFVEEYLGMPCQIRLVEQNPGVVEDVLGIPIGKAQELEALERLEELAEHCESEPEKKFFWGCVKHGIILRPQFRVARYRLDFADRDIMMAVEIDGREFHSTPEQQERDRQREGDLKTEGWDVTRFSGKQIEEDVAACVREFLAKRTERLLKLRE